MMEMMNAATLRKKFPQLNVVERSPHELEVSSPSRPQQLLKITLPHLDVQCEAIASWASAKQVIRVDAGRVGHVQETSPFHDEPDAWTVSFDVWLAEWLALLSGNGAGPARPGRNNS